jgi:hypothetical protein
MPDPPRNAPHSDPKVQELLTMFPSVDPSVVVLILESVHGSQDRAIEQLLTMTDPEFKPDSGVHHEDDVCPYIFPA